MPQLSTNPAHIQAVVDLMANMIGFLTTLRSDCEGDLARYRDEYVATVEVFFTRWETLCDQVLLTQPRTVYNPPTNPADLVDTGLSLTEPEDESSEPECDDDVPEGNRSI